ncbi:alpha/beta hydrolase family protein [Pseudoxanthomonas indica]|uniref:Dipeptidyl aminopeptidase/acylaminoacyl peptidase n=1 Tax=Pseudoxanthomonas indica TaxID=428993 RepID=A0A1T5L8Z5_9GAMM|nr:S9 family peptidase [Pseudoxanthomonas indica]GGD32173.1 peptidase S9 [Pseudoxanthomonas indica]SKC72472.1 Dipeptidyl aminopeptidase/acylaminoacyl peptidase [Pseudoxanthomonas indica]
MKLGWMLALLACAQAAPAAAQVDLEPFLKEDPYQQLKISPKGDYLATTSPVEDRTVLVVLSLPDLELTASVGGDRNSVVDEFWWANNERVVVALADKFGSRDTPSITGTLHAVNADGSKGKVLASPYGEDPEAPGISTGVTTPRYYLMSDPLPNNDKHVLVEAIPLTSNDAYVRLETLDIYSRRRTLAATAPVRRASFLADGQGVVRFAYGRDADNTQRLYYRPTQQAEWKLVNDEKSSRHSEYPIGFSADGQTASLQVEQSGGPDRLFSWQPADGRYTELLKDTTVDPYRILYDLDNRTPIGAQFMTDRVRNRFFDDQHPTARLYRSLEKAFGEDAFFITSVTDDRRLAVIYVWSDRNNGDYFLFDLVNKSAKRLLGRREWMNPAQMPQNRAISYQTRDGLTVHGYLTRPVKAPPGPLPMVLLPHGGPFGIFDSWNFDDDAAMLSQAGYAVLRVNYRGSGNYGSDFTEVGAQEWGAKMQDDLTDATRWAIEQKIAEPGRICIYGASYGGYAALMGVAREPDLYRCAAGYVGVYDLNQFHRRQSNRSRSGRTWAGEWMGSPETLAARSPVNLADRIKVPVFLAAGGKDERAPITHTKAMEKALKNHGVPVESLYYPNEGHGFYTKEHKREYYTRLLAFLSRHLGGQAAKP